MFNFRSIVLVIGLLLNLFTLKYTLVESAPQVGKMCKTNGCLLLASKLIPSMDQSLNPCEDLYEFVCSDFANNYPIPKYELLQDAMNGIEEETDGILKAILEANVSNSDSAIAKAREMYKVCMDVDGTNRVGLVPLQFLIAELGGWPLILGPSWNPGSKERVFWLLGQVARYGLKTKLMSINVVQDGMNPNRNIVEISPPYSDEDFHMKKKKLRIKRNIREIEMQILTIAKLLGADISILNKREIRDVIFIDFRLESYSRFRKKKTPIDEFNVFTIKQLNTLTEHRVNWLLIINTLFGGIKTFSLNDTLVVTAPNYLQNVANLIATENARSLTNYILYQISFNMLQHLNSEAVKIFDEANLELEPYPRLKYCITQTKRAFEHALGHEYIKNFADEAAIKTTKTIFDFEVDAFIKILKDSEWLDTITKTSAIRKLSNMKYFIGYPSWITNETAVDEFYSDVVISDNHFMNILLKKINKTTTNLKELQKEIDKNKWTSPYLSANAYYDEQENSICIPIVVMKTPYLDASSLMVTNFGALGSTMGHELGHGFDVSGSYYDENGKLYQWWTKKNRLQYNKKTQCFIQQYDNYCPFEMKSGRRDGDDLCLNGEAALSENIADNLGLEIAYKAYKLWAKNKTSGQLLGLSQFSEDQLFFISYAYTECENIDQKDYREYHAGSKYSPGKYRVIGSIENFDEFYKVFNCPRKQKHSCKVW